MLYLIEATLYSGILYAVYFSVLRNNTSHSWNRFYLLLCASLPCFLPLVSIPGIALQTPLYTVIRSVQLPEISISFNNSAQKINVLAPNLIFTAIYLSVTTVLLLRFALQYWSFKRLLIGKKCVPYPDNVKVITGCGYGPGSFGNYVFFPGEEIPAEILQHELLHIRHRHSIDIVCMKLLQAIFWPNAMLYVIMKELKMIHEFEADVPLSISKDEYIRSLLNDIFQTQRFSLSHTFFHHPIKRRIIMLHKTPQSRKTLRATIIKSGVLAASLIAGVIYLQSCNHQPDVTNVTPKLRQENPTETTQKNGVLSYAERMPESSVNISQFMGEHIKYPEEARKNKIEGRVIVRFIIDAEGNVQSPVAMRSPNALLTEEAIRVIKLMPKWKPGSQDGKNVAVYFTLPISFKLD